MKLEIRYRCEVCDTLHKTEKEATECEIGCHKAESEPRDYIVAGDLCPDCGEELHGTYEINEETKPGEDPRIYGVICSGCCFESYDE